MLFTYPTLDDEEKRVEEATARLRADLRRYVAEEPRRWDGLVSPYDPGSRPCRIQ